MNDFFTQLQNKARTTKLAPDEKQVMRVQLYNYLEANSGYEAASVSAPMRSVPSMQYWFAPRFAMPFAALLLVVFSGGTAFAAQNALPGDALYAIKINVNEAVQTALATSPVAKAEVEASLATNRLEEAETLAANGKLDATVTAQLASNFERHVSVAQDTAANLESDDPGTAAQLNAKFDGALAAHGAILTLLGDDSSNEETIHNSNQLAIQVQGRIRTFDADDETNNSGNANGTATLTMSATATDTAADSAEGSTVRSFSTVAPQVAPMALNVGNQASSSATGSASSKISAKSAPTTLAAATPQETQKDTQAAVKLGAQASTSLLMATKHFAALQSSLDAATAALVSAQLANAQQELVQANASLTAGDATTAKESFTHILRFSSRLDAYLKAGKKFNITLLTSLIDSSRAYNTKGDTQTNEALKGEVKAPNTSSGSNTKVEVQGDDATTSNSASAEVHKGTDNLNGSAQINLHL